MLWTNDIRHLNRLNSSGRHWVVCPAAAPPSPGRPRRVQGRAGLRGLRGVNRSSRLHATVTAQECARALISICSGGARVRAQPATGLEVEEGGRTRLLELGERWRCTRRRAKFYSLKLCYFGRKFGADHDGVPRRWGFYKVVDFSAALCAQTVLFFTGSHLKCHNEPLRQTLPSGV